MGDADAAGCSYGHRPHVCCPAVPIAALREDVWGYARQRDLKDLSTKKALKALTRTELAERIRGWADFPIPACCASRNVGKGKKAEAAVPEEPAPAVQGEKKKHGLTPDALKELLKAYNRESSTKVVEKGSHKELAQRCFDLGLIDADARDAPPPRERAPKLSDGERKKWHDLHGPSLASSSPMVVVSTRLCNVVRDTEKAKGVHTAVRDAVHRMHQLSTAATHLVRLWMLDDPSVERCAAVLEEDTYRFAMEAVSEEGVHRTKRGTECSPALRAELGDFFTQRFLPLMPLGGRWGTLMPEGGEWRASRKNLTQMIKLESQRLVAGAKTNIKEHLVSHAHAFINRMFGVKRNAPRARGDARNAHFAKYRQAKKDLLALPGQEVLSDDPEVLAVIDAVRQRLPAGPFAEESIAYDVHVRPQAYIPAMLFMAGQLIEAGRKAFQVLPLRLSNAPAYVTIDTKALVDISGWKANGDKLTYDNKVRLWDEYLAAVKTDMKTDANLHLEMAPVFRRGKQSAPRYVFRGSISTDGVGVSIGLVRVDLRDLKGIDGPWKNAAKACKEKESIKLPYVDEVEDPVAKLSGRSYAVIDPGKRDLHFAMHSDGRQMRYTRLTRHRHTKRKRYGAIRKGLHKEAGVLGGRTVAQWNEELASWNSRATETHAFEGWIRAKMACLAATAAHWRQETFRRLKFNAKVNARRSEDTYASKLREKIGKPEECVLIVGDWSCGTGNLKRSPPSPRRGLLKVLRRHGYELWLLKEQMTSARCSKCCDAHSRCEPAEMDGKARHGLLRCKNATCEQFHNRNANATRNMLRVVQAALEGEARPRYLVCTRGT